MMISPPRPRTSILDKPIPKGKTEMSLTTFALLFSEIIQYYQSEVQTVPELQAKLHRLGMDIGSKIVDLYYIRENGLKRGVKLLNVLIFVKSTVWKYLFGKEADKLEKSNDDENTYYLKEAKPVVNTYISVPKDKSSLNCAAFTAGIVQAFLCHCGFPAKVAAHWYQGTTYVIEFEEAVKKIQESSE